MFQRFQIIHDIYAIKEKIGSGAQGETYRLEHPKNPEAKDVVGKCLIDDLLADHEAETLRALKHKNVVLFLEYFQEAGTCWLIMEYCDDGDLNSLIISKKKQNSSFSQTEIVNIFEQIMQGVQYLHSKLVIHRDIKPSNIFLTAGTVKIGDFGIARAFDPEGSPIMTCVGTLPYMSPEILDGKGYTQSTDLWACGCILYEMCCLEPLFGGSTFADIFCILNKGDLPKVYIDAYDGFFSKPYQSLVSLDPSKRLSAEKFLKKYFTEVYSSRKTVLLVGMSGVGKSSLGNLIAGREFVKTSDGVAGCTQDHKVYLSNDTGITIIDTMGMADPNETDAQIRHKISEALEATTDGVDLILFCLQLGRVNRETEVVFDTLMTTFGDGCRRNLCLILTRSGSEYVMGEWTDLVSIHNEYLRVARNDEGEAGRIFRKVCDACSDRVIFTENPPKTKIKKLEECQQEIRDVCRGKVIRFIHDSRLEKFTSEAALRYREEEKLRVTEVLNMREEILLKQQEFQKQKIAAETCQAECEKWKRRCQLQIEYDSLHQAYIREKRVREFVHERFCPRKTCRSWSEIVDKKRRALPSDKIGGIKIEQLWLEHREICKICGSCKICPLENKLSEAYGKREDILEALTHGSELSELNDLKGQLEELCAAEWEDSMKKWKCTIM